jgi:flagellar motor switch protein FliG
MTTQSEATVAGRVLHARGVAETPETSPVSWTAPPLRPEAAAPPLPIVLGEKATPGRAVAEPPYPRETGMVLVKGSEFVMGSEDGSEDEHPGHVVLLSSYWIDKYPVTNEAYKKFTDATGHRKPPHWTSGKGTYPLEHAWHPVTNVNWHDAAAYASWAGKRLPTEAEWEKAARGTQGQVYPWGDAFRKDYINSCEDYEGTTSVDRFPAGVSPYGALDMCGNVLEWCSDWYQRDFYRESWPDNPEQTEPDMYRVCRGGLYSSSKEEVRCATRHFAPPASRQDHIGFRCAKSPSQSRNKVPVGASAAPDRQLADTHEPDPVRPVSEEDSLEHIAASRPELVARLLQTLVIEQTATGEKRNQGLSPVRKAAVLLVSLGSDLSAGVLKRLGDDEVRQIALEIADVEIVDREQRLAVFEEAMRRLISEDYVHTGGVEFARTVVQKAIGPGRARTVFQGVADAATGGFYLLHDIDPEHLIPFLAKEHPQTIALILTQLDTHQAAGVMNGLPEDLLGPVAHRLANMDNVRPETLRRLEENLSDELQAVLAGQVTQIGGPSALAEILNRTGRSIEKAAIEYVDKQDADLGERVRLRMFVFDDIGRLPNREIQGILQEVESKDLAVAMKGASEEMQKRVFSSMSEEEGKQLKQEIEITGPMRMSDVEKVQLRIVQTVRQLEKAGKVTIVRGDSTDVFV